MNATLVKNAPSLGKIRETSDSIADWARACPFEVSLPEQMSLLRYMLKHPDVTEPGNAYLLMD